MKNIINKSISQSISQNNNQKGIFDCFLTNFEGMCNKSASTIQELQKRENKHTKGRLWEEFCFYYLNNVLNYRNVWLWKDVPNDVKKQLNLKQSHVDNGIDIIAKLNDKTGFVAIQCKYRKNIKQTVTWTTLATFVGLCALSGPWDKHIVMTNCRGVTRKVPKGPKDQTMAYGTFANMKRENWLKMCDNYIEHKLNEESLENNQTDINEDVMLIGNGINDTLNDNSTFGISLQNNILDLIREARLKKFET